MRDGLVELSVQLAYTVPCSDQPTWVNAEVALFTMVSRLLHKIKNAVVNVCLLLSEIISRIDSFYTS